MKKYFLILLTLFLISCSKGIPVGLMNSTVSILEENQIVYDLLLQNKIPELTNLKSKLSLAIEESKTIPIMQTKLTQLNESIPSKKIDSMEEANSILSNFSEKFAQILSENKIKTDYNKFYCPMVSKYWIAKGIEINNPYAPEMRDCGELVK